MHHEISFTKSVEVHCMSSYNPESKTYVILAWRNFFFSYALLLIRLAFHASTDKFGVIFLVLKPIDIGGWIHTSKVLSLLKDPYLKTRAKCRLKEKVLTHFNALPTGGKKKCCFTWYGY